MKIYIKSESILAWGGSGLRAPHPGESEEHYRERHLNNIRQQFEAGELRKWEKSLFHRYKRKPFKVTQEVMDELDALVEEFKDQLDLPIPTSESDIDTPEQDPKKITRLENCPNCGGTVLDNGRCAYCGNKVYTFSSKRTTNRKYPQSYVRASFYFDVHADDPAEWEIDWDEFFDTIENCLDQLGIGYEAEVGPYDNDWGRQMLYKLSNGKVLDSYDLETEILHELASNSSLSQENYIIDYINNL